MTSDTKEQDAKGIDRRHFLMAGAVGAASIAAAGVGMNAAWAQPNPPDPKNLSLIMEVEAIENMDPTLAADESARYLKETFGHLL